MFISSGETSTVYLGSDTRFLDEDARLRPFSDYEYRIHVVNGAGSTASLWARVRTHQAAPEGVSPPVVKVFCPLELMAKSCHVS